MCGPRGSILLGRSFGNFRVVDSSAVLRISLTFQSQGFVKDNVSRPAKALQVIFVARRVKRRAYCSKYSGSVRSLRHIDSATSFARALNIRRKLVAGTCMLGGP